MGLTRVIESLGSMIVILPRWDSYTLAKLVYTIGL
jgi:hypothetical protein